MTITQLKKELRLINKQIKDISDVEGSGIVLNMLYIKRGRITESIEQKKKERKDGK